MSVAQLPPASLSPQHFFSAHWLGLHPLDGRPRVVECFGPSVRYPSASIDAAALGLRSTLRGKPPRLSRVSAEFDGQRLTLYSRGHLLMRTGSLPPALAAVLRSRAEVLLVWVDIPLADPRTQLSRVGAQHVWAGIAPIDGREPREPPASPHHRSRSHQSRSAPVRRPA